MRSYESEMPPLKSCYLANFWIDGFLIDEREMRVGWICSDFSLLSPIKSLIGEKLSKFAISFENYEARHTSELSITSILWQLISLPS
jgi:hypothetical protein